MRSPAARTLISAAVILVLAAPGAQSQSVPEDQGLAGAAAAALVPGMRAALRGGQPVSFESQSPWGESVRKQLEESLGVSLSGEHRRGASRILLGDPDVNADTAVVEVWFGRCEAVRDAETLKIRRYAFAFEREAEDWQLVRSARLGTTESSCDGDLNIPPSAQAWADIRQGQERGSVDLGLHPSEHQWHDLARRT